MAFLASLLWTLAVLLVVGFIAFLGAAWVLAFANEAGPWS